MREEENSTREIEIAHVLFMDVVGFSRLPMGQQTAILEELRDIVSKTAELRQAAAAVSDLIRIPTGDGMALVFFRNPVTPVKCAIAISQALQTRPHIKLRMGLNTGPVHRVEDINATANVAGSAINLAERVMDCSDAGHILLSSALADLLRQVGTWAPYLHDLGECEVKHGERIHIFNLCADGFGNPEVPEKLIPPPPAATTLQGHTGEDARPASATLRVALLYKRNALPDEQLLALLENQLKANGYEVFIDRHLKIGVEWAKEIEKQVRNADAVIPLLSDASVNSEMLAYEVQIANDAAQQQGKPRLLPIRVNYAGPLPQELAGILDRLQYFLWEKPEDDDRLAKEVTEALRNPQASRHLTPEKLESIGGAVALGSEFYVVRPTDQELDIAMSRRDSIVLIKGARQMGKTSLLARGLQRARENGSRVVLVDYQQLSASHLQSAEAFFMALANAIADQLDLDVLPDDVWKEGLGPTVNFERYLRRQALQQIPTHLVWAMDEVDRLFTCSFASEAFGLLRSWHNRRSLDPSGPWSKLTLTICYATEAHLFITDINQSPFNVGTRLTLQDFTIDQVADLNQRYGGPLQHRNEIQRFHMLLGGQPYLVRRALNEMVAYGMTLQDMVTKADAEDGPFGDHLRRFLVLLAQDGELCDVLRRILKGQPCPNAESFYRLRSAGIVTGESVAEAVPRCQLYATYLSRHLL